MTDRIGKPPVENLSEVTWARVERGVFARLDSAHASGAESSAELARARQAWKWIALPVAVAAVIAIVIVATRPREPATIAQVEPSRVVSGDAPSAITFGDAHVALDADSAVTLSDDAGSPTVLLERGAAWFSVAPRGSRPPFFVLAGDTTVRVIGTRFRVARDGERADVAVDHGTVEVTYRGGVVRVTDGQSWSTLAPTQVAVPAPAPLPAAVPAPAPVPVTPPIGSASPPTPAPAHHRDPDQARYEALAAVEARHPDAAIKGYLELSQGSGRWAALALYSAARLAVDRKDPRAEMLLTVYLRRFPSGANAADVKYLLDRLQGATP